MVNWSLIGKDVFHAAKTGANDLLHTAVAPIEGPAKQLYKDASDIYSEGSKIAHDLEGPAHKKTRRTGLGT